MRPTYQRLAGLLAAVVLALTATAVDAATTAKPTQPDLVITGAGDGHGVGLSQDGALGYAEHGFGYAAILAHYYTGTALGQAPTGATVRVLLGSGRLHLAITGAARLDGRAASGRTAYTIAAGRGALSARAGRRVLASRTVLEFGGHGALRVGGLSPHRTAEYLGTLQVSATASGLEIVNVVDLEDYTRGVVAGEVPPSWPVAALEAQAVASRTFALTTHVQPGAGGFDVYADTRSQVYGGVGAQTATTNAAVAATAGQVVTYAGAPVATYFFADSGGRTEDIENAFPGAAPEPWLRGVPDPYDAGPGDAWTRTFTFAAAAAKLGGLVQGTLRGVEVLQRGYSPRIVRAEVLGSRGDVAVTGPELAARLGLPSTWGYFYTEAGGRLSAEPDTSGQRPPATTTTGTSTSSTTTQSAVATSPSGGTPAG